MMSLEEIVDLLQRRPRGWMLSARIENRHHLGIRGRDRQRIRLVRLGFSLAHPAARLELEPEREHRKRRNCARRLRQARG